MDNIFNKSTLGLNIKHLRSANSITQSKLSQLLGVKSTSISNWEVGISSPDLDILAKISNYFGVSLDELILVSHNNWKLKEKIESINYDQPTTPNLPTGPCQQCQQRERVIESQAKTISLLEDKIETLEKGGNNVENDRRTDYKQTG